jgi:microsomal dipeptidase-like Zn-dependent dipeptidase
LLTDALLQAKMPEQTIAKILRTNGLRVLHEIP